MSGERMNDLADFYKYVRICSKCKGKYGSDFKHEAYMNICPKCYQGRSQYAKTGWKGNKGLLKSGLYISEDLNTNTYNK